ncbi:MAG: hypothetical protein ABGZ49_14615 [Akkermansiaceae bacterium]
MTCYGQAGTGKTLVSIAAGLHEVYGRHDNGLTTPPVPAGPRRKQSKKDGAEHIQGRPLPSLTNLSWSRE